MNKKEFNAWIESRLDSFAQVLPNKKRPWEGMNGELTTKKLFIHWLHMTMSAISSSPAIP